jgi:hypothetical protein
MTAYQGPEPDILTYAVDRLLTAHGFHVDVPGRLYRQLRVGYGLDGPQIDRYEALRRSGELVMIEWLFNEL